MNQILRRYSYWVQIFCLINCTLLYTPLIKFGQLVSPVKWDNPDFNTNVKVKIIPFLFLPQLLFLLSISGFWFLFFLFSMWLTLTRTLLSIVFCCSFSFLFGLFPLLSHCIPIFLPKFYCPLLQRFLLSYRSKFVFNFWETQTSNLQGFQGFFFSLLYVIDVSSVHFHPHFAPVTDTSSLHLHFQVFIYFYWFLQSDLSMVIMVFDFCSIMKHVERKTFLDNVKVVVNK